MWNFNNVIIEIKLISQKYRKRDINFYSLKCSLPDLAVCVSSDEISNVNFY